MKKERLILGNWMGSLYGGDGTRFEWKLSLETDGSYLRTIHVSTDHPVTERGRWTHDVDADMIQLDATNGDSSNWSILDVTNSERANTLLVLRRLAVASRNLPIILYRIHLQDMDCTAWHGCRADGPLA